MVSLVNASAQTEVKELEVAFLGKPNVIRFQIYSSRMDEDNLKNVKIGSFKKNNYRKA
jgi:hypothetical protein